MEHFLAQLYNLVSRNLAFTIILPYAVHSCAKIIAYLKKAKVLHFAWLVCAKKSTYILRRLSKINFHDLTRDVVEMCKESLSKPKLDQPNFKS